MVATMAARPTVVMSAAPAPSVMMTFAAAAHVTVTMTMTALYQHDGITGVGGYSACRNTRHR